MIDTRRLDLTDRNAFVRSLQPSLKIAEIGVLNGEFAAVIQDCGPSEQWMVDCWIAPPDYPVDGVTLMQINADYMRAYMGVLRAFAGCYGAHVLRAFSQEAAPHFADGYFDVVYIDADHLDCGSDIQAWWSKVKSGGVLAGHDYVDEPTSQEPNRVKQDVDAFVSRTGLELLLTREPLASWIIQKP